MKRNKICCVAAVIVTFILFIVSGCSEPNGNAKSQPKHTNKTKITSTGQKGPVRLTLNFTPGESAKYKVVQEIVRQAKWEGPEARKPPGFKGGQSGNRIEMVFNQDIQSINDNGNAIAKITIEKLKYQTTVTDSIAMDFDSSKKTPENEPLSRLIGQSYTIEITPTGRVAKVVDVNDILKAVSPNLNRTAAQLLSVGAIKQRHTITALPTGEKQEYNIGDNWEVVKDISFDQMGTKSFGKTYTLEEIQQAGKNRTAIVEMNALPSVKHIKELYKEQTALPFPFDSTDTYTGRLKLSLTKGSVEECNEKLTTEWIIMDPATTNTEKPDAIRIAAMQFYSIEKMD
ncbi:MAG: hypothetical protein JW715_11480 [Sedimentisphaerales bacterium]|nr:hypothetical protein [Sedimentisphaerales bacterium]